jgi:hypothetical protein
MSIILSGKTSGGHINRVIIYINIFSILRTTVRSYQWMESVITFNLYSPLSRGYRTVTSSPSLSFLPWSRDHQKFWTRMCVCPLDHPSHFFRFHSFTSRSFDTIDPLLIGHHHYRIGAPCFAVPPYHINFVFSRNYGY